MNSHDIGKIIKEARLSKKMTQNEVVGNFITRNMLSQIESGTAMPSVRTLEYLCNTLDIQLEALTDCDVKSENGITDYLTFKDVFNKHQYDKIIENPLIPNFEDECLALKAQAFLIEAQNFSNSNELSGKQKAVEYAKNALDLASKGLFASEKTTYAAKEIIQKCAAKLSDYYGNLLKY